ncbi:hypothetical protein D0Z07_1362 [Hyphodiscus hymeniophilus]|uniref:Uncharacterized protein n=1 Tax=Hyphodiscus hymeniophilus TaxID=353542 RepID=A0A9P6VPS1_9HELO|nr:hypothetical protein D0Z07_1362 [Hyphodiscus hymeniophilus]
MQRPRNRQGAGDSQVARSRGRGGRRGGGGGERPLYSPNSSNVPNTGQVVPGGFVSIVLKVDQPTGREVQGIVADVLTNGNHPRGIKVRLVDGRVGRVQKIVTEEEARAGSDGLSGLSRNGEQAADTFPPRIDRRIRDMRHEDETGIPASGYSLADFLPVENPLREEHTELLPAAETSGPVSTCPVCGEFEGDEFAVSHHVNSHFD